MIKLALAILLSSQSQGLKIKELDDQDTADHGLASVAVGKGNNIQIAINFCVNLGDETNCPKDDAEIDCQDDAGETSEHDQENESEGEGGIDIDINGEDIISDGEPVSEDEDPMPTGDCAEVF